MTDYNDITTYEMEKNPSQVRRDTLDCLAAGEDEQVIDACLTRSEWIADGNQILHRISIRKAEIRECDAFFTT